MSPIKIIALVLSVFFVNQIVSHETIDTIISKRIVLCTGPSLGRKEVLVEVTQRDLKLIPFKKIFIVTNDPKNLDITFGNTPTITKYFDEQGKQLDCLNCIIHSLKLAIQDKTIDDDDIILFKHESVYISDMYLIHKAIQKLQQGHEMVVKFWLGKGIQTSSGYNDYFHTDSFFITVKAARAAFKDLKEVPFFTKDYQFCEEYFSKYVVSRLKNVYKIDYHHSNWKDNELGFYHIPRYAEDPNWYWDKKNYYEIY